MASRLGALALILGVALPGCGHFSFYQTERPAWPWPRPAKTAKKSEPKPAPFIDITDDQPPPRPQPDPGAPSHPTNSEPATQGPADKPHGLTDI